jgi:hypothetical protein
MFSNGEKAAFLWGVGSIVFIVAVLFASLFTKLDIGGAVYAMLGGSIVGMAAAILAITRGVSPGRSAFLIFSGLVGSLASFLFSLILLKIATMTLYGQTDLLLGLIIGIVGSSSTCFFFMSQYINGAGLLRIDS